MPVAGGKRGRPKGEGAVGEAVSSSWVKKDSSQADASGDGDHGGEDRGKGKGSGKAKGARRDLPVGAAPVPTEDNTETSGKGKGSKGGKKGAGKKGAAQTSGQIPNATSQRLDGTSDDKENASEEEASRENGCSTLLNMLKANLPAATKYSKGELLAIARLPGSNVKPPGLDPLIDKSNVESPLLLAVSGGRKEKDEADIALARRERRERRRELQAQQRRAREQAADDSEDEDEDEDDECPPQNGRENAVGSTGSKADGDEFAAKQLSHEEKAPPFEKWTDKSLAAAAAAATASSATSSAAGASTGPSMNINAPVFQARPSTSSPPPGSLAASYLEAQRARQAAQEQAASAAGGAGLAQQAAQAQVQAMRMSAYMQALSMNAAAMGWSSGSCGGGHPWRYGSAYGLPPYGNYPGGYGSFNGAGDYGLPPSATSAVMQAKLAAAAAAQQGRAASAAARALAAAKATPPPKIQPKASPKATPKPKASPPATASAPPPLFSSSALSLPQAEPGDDDEEGCTQS